MRNRSINQTVHIIVCKHSSRRLRLTKKMLSQKWSHFIKKKKKKLREF